MTIAVDFDGVIHAYSRGWHNGTIYDPPLPGALDGLRELMAHDAVFIFTTRDVSQVAEWLIGRQFNVRIGYDGLFWNERGSLLVTNRKLAATAYLDDRAVRFESWGHALGVLLPDGPAQLPRDGAPLTASQTNTAPGEAHQPLLPERPSQRHTEPRRCARCGDHVKLWQPTPGPLNPGPGWVHLDGEPRGHAAVPETDDGEHPNAAALAAVDEAQARQAEAAALRPAWNDGDPLMTAVAVAVWEHCRTSGPSNVVDDPRNIAAAAVAAVRARHNTEGSTTA